MFFAHLRIDVVVGANRVIAHIRRVGAVDEVRTPALVDAFIQRIGQSVGVIGAVATVSDEIAVVLEHVEVIVGYDALHLFFRPLLGFRIAKIDGLTLERLRLPVRGDVGHHPVAHLRITRIESTRFSGESGLRPVNPDSELEPMLVGIVSDDREASRKLLRIGMPVAYVTEPPGIDVKHVDAEVGGVANHTFGNLFIYIHAATPTIVDHERIVRILPGDGISQDGAYPGTKNIPGAVGTIAKSSEEYDRRFETFVWLDAGAERARIGVKPEIRSERIFFARQRDTSAATEFDARIPTAARGVASFDKRPWNDFPRQVFENVAVRARSAGPMKAFADRNLMGALV